MVFTPGQEEAIGQLAETIGDIFTDRWHRKQFEDFQNNELAAYSTQAASLQAQIAREEDPDAMAATFNQWGKMTRDFLTSSSKYADNPYIANISQQIFAATNTGLSDFLTAEQQFEERTPEAKAQREEMREAELAGTRAGTEADLARAEQARAEAGLLRKRIQHPELFQSGAAKAQQMFLGPPGTPPNQWLANMYRPDLTNVRQQQMDEIALELAQKELNRLRGTKKPGPMGEVWGTGEDDLKILQNQVPEDEIRRIWERRTIEREAMAMGVDPQAAIAIFGDRYEQETPTQKFRPMTGQVTDDRIVENLLGPSTASGLKMTTGTEKLDIDKLADELPEGIGTLGAGPLQMPFHETLQSGGVVPGLGTTVETYGQLTKLLEARGVTLINHHIGGSDIPDSKLEPGTLKARQRARKLYMAMIKKYAPQVALGLGVEAPKAEPGVMSLLRESTPVKLLRSGFEEIKGILNTEDDDTVTIE